MASNTVDLDTAALAAEDGTALPVEDGAAVPAEEGSAEEGAGGWVLAGRYRIAGRLGQGGVAEVFRARDAHLGRDVAVKVFRSSTTDATTDAERRDVELQALARLSHPNLVTLFDASVGEGNDPEFLVMELVDGATLADALASGPLPVDRVRELGVQLASALAYVHESGVVHRDVKPGNILLGNDGTGGLRARLSDFGIARIIGGARLTRAGLTIGTAAYLAPEQVRGSEVGPEADVYALGLVLLEALTGQRCFEGSPSEAAVARLARGPQVPGHLPAPWPELLVAMTSADPADRPTAAEVARSLGAQEVRFPIDPVPVVGVPQASNAITAELPVADLAPAAPAFAARAQRVQRVPRRRRTLRPLVLAAMLLILGIAGAAAYVLSSSARPQPTPPTAPSHPAVATHSPSATHHHSRASHQSAAPVADRSTQSLSHSHSAKPSHAQSSTAPRTTATSTHTTTTTPPPTTTTTTTTTTASTTTPPPTTGGTTSAATSAAPPPAVG